MGQNLNPSYIISAFPLSLHTTIYRPLPSGVSGGRGPGRRAHRTPSGVTGWRSLALVDELTGATSSGSCPALTSICWPWSTCSANSKESSPRPSMRPTSWGSARTRRARTGREAVEVVGVVLGYLASWHDRGPGGRHDDGARSRGRGHPRPQSGLDRNGSNLNPSRVGLRGEPLDARASSPRLALRRADAGHSHEFQGCLVGRQAVCSIPCELARPPPQAVCVHVGRGYLFRVAL